MPSPPCPTFSTFFHPLPPSSTRSGVFARPLFSRVVLVSTQVAVWLRTITLERFADKFVETQLTGELLFEVTDDVLIEDFGMTSKLDRIKVPAPSYHKQCLCICCCNLSTRLAYCISALGGREGGLTYCCCFFVVFLGVFFLPLCTLCDDHFYSQRLFRT